MPLTIGWAEIALRLVLTILAGALIGWNRGEHGHPAGMRTTILVCLTASLAMIEVNLLLDTRGKPADSFVVLDLARYPLGILSGMGFIGAGAILRRGGIVEGLTTAATLWLVTMIGLCIGGGQFGIGIAVTVVGFLVLELLKRLENALPVERHATIELVVEADSSVPEAVADRLRREGCSIVERGSARETAPVRRRISYDVHWRAASDAPAPTRTLDQLAREPGVIAFAWELGAGSARERAGREV